MLFDPVIRYAIERLAQKRKPLKIEFLRIRAVSEVALGPLRRGKLFARLESGTAKRAAKKIDLFNFLLAWLSHPAPALSQPEPRRAESIEGKD